MIIEVQQAVLQYLGLILHENIVLQIDTIIETKLDGFYL